MSLWDSIKDSVSGSIDSGLDYAKKGFDIWGGVQNGKADRELNLAEIRPAPIPQPVYTPTQTTNNNNTIMYIGIAFVGVIALFGVVIRK